MWSGSYEPGRFLSHSVHGLYDEMLVFHPDLLGHEEPSEETLERYKGLRILEERPGPLRTARIVTLLHETSHLVQDLSVGACLASDALHDTAGTHVLALATDPPDGELRCPLSLHPLSSPEQAEHAHEALTARAAAVDIFEGRLPLSVPDDLDAALPRFLTGRMLLEGVTTNQVAYVLALRCLRAGAGTPASSDLRAEAMQYLRGVRQHVALLPEDLSIKYSGARRLFDHLLPMGGPGATDPRVDDGWPEGYFESARPAHDVAFGIVADIALHIPPPHVAAGLVGHGAPRQAFDPVRRFMDAIAHFRARGGGLPDADVEKPTAGRFYRQLFDELSDDEELGWLSLDATDALWSEHWHAGKARRGAASDGYRHRMVGLRVEDPAIACLEDPLKVVLRESIPVLHATPTALKVLHGFVLHGPSEPEPRYVLLPSDMPPLDVHGALRWSLGTTTRWTDATTDGPLEDEIVKELTKLPLMLREVIFRCFFRALLDAVLGQPHFACPFARRGCSTARPTCARLACLDDAPEADCALRVYLTLQRIEPGAVRWVENENA